MDNGEQARDLADALVNQEDPEATRAAAIVYALLALADEIRNLGAEVEKAGWALRK